MSFMLGEAYRAIRLKGVCRQNRQARAGAADLHAPRSRVGGYGCGRE